MTVQRGFNQAHLKTIREIFFESSSRRNFNDQAEKERFFQRWTEYYLSEHPESVYIAFDHDQTVIGYLMGCPDSRRAMEHYSSTLKSYSLFADLFDRFPAHLHINLAERARGRGIGAQLINAFIRDLEGCPGLHIVTSPEARNRGFYLNNGFHFLVEREQNGTKFLFMGRPL